MRVEEIEVIIDPPSITLRSGERAQFDCSARGHIDVESIEWSRDGAPLPRGRPIHCKKNIIDVKNVPIKIKKKR